MLRRELAQILLGQFKQTYCWPQSPAVFRMFRVLEIFLQMNEGAGGLDQAFEKIVIGRIFLQPNLFQDVVRLVVLLLVPTLEICAVKWMIDHVPSGRICIIANQLTYESRNPLAFVHQGLNVVPARTMSKPATEDKRMQSSSRVKE